MTAQIIIFTDLDGTLLDHETYSADAALPVFQAAQAQDIPVVFCSSKTRAELEVLQTRLKNRAPFTVENGGAVFIPAGTLTQVGEGYESRDGYDVIEFGTPYPELVSAFRVLRNQLSYQLIGFSDLTVAEIARQCGLDPDTAILAKAREYDEPFWPSVHGRYDEDDLRSHIRRTGLRCSRGGRFWHLHGNNDKGMAVKLLTELYRRKFGALLTVGLGDGDNDLPMLQAVDRPVVIRRPDGSMAASLTAHLPEVLTTRETGPRAWAEAVTRIMREQEINP